MFTDIVFPNNNEEDFIEIASKLGYGQLSFIYELKDIKNIKNKIENLQKNTKIKLDFGILTNFNNINKAKKLTKLVIIKSSNKNRHVLEKSRNILLFGLEENPKKDYIHHRASGLNHILCKLANKNNIKIGFSFSLILSSNQKSKILGRIKQNLKLCRKYKINTVIASFAKNPYEMRALKDLGSLFKVLGMGQKGTNDTIEKTF